MDTHHRHAGCPVYIDIDLHIEVIGSINTGPDNDNESTSGSDSTIAFGGSEADSHPSELILSNQAKLTALIYMATDHIECCRSCLHVFLQF